MRRAVLMVGLGVAGMAAAAAVAAILDVMTNGPDGDYYDPRY